MVDEGFKSLALEKAGRGSLRNSCPSNTSKYSLGYLRASTGSCHDICKYGKHAVSERQPLAEKTKRATLAKSKPLPNCKSMPISKTRSLDGLDMPKLKTHVIHTSRAINREVPSSDKARLTVKSINDTKTVIPIRSKPRKQWGLRNDHDESHEKILHVISNKTKNPPSESDQNQYGNSENDNAATRIKFGRKSSMEENVKSNAAQERVMLRHQDLDEPHEKILHAISDKTKNPPSESDQNQYGNSENDNAATRIDFGRKSSMEENVKSNAAQERVVLRHQDLDEPHEKILHAISDKTKNPPQNQYGNSENDNAATRIEFGRKSSIEENGKSNAAQEHVVLRHQDLEEKREMKGLLVNRVIEEAASKLGGKEKSKVKALVGAFETLITLQDSKPFAPIVN